MDSRGRRIVRKRTQHHLHYLFVIRDFFSSFILHALSLIIVGAFIIWVLNQV